MSAILSQLFFVLAIAAGRTRRGTVQVQSRSPLAKDQLKELQMTKQMCRAIPALDSGQLGPVEEREESLPIGRPRTILQLLFQTAYVKLSIIQLGLYSARTSGY